MLSQPRRSGPSRRSGAASGPARRSRASSASLDVSAAARQISQSDFVLQEATLEGRSDSWIARELGDSASLAATTRRSSAVARGRATSDEGLGVRRTRLRDRLNDFGLREHEVAGDGNCQCRAPAHQLARADAERRAGEVAASLAPARARARAREDFCVVDEASVDADFDGFVRRMAKDAEWGDNVTLQAAADAYGAPPAHARTIWVAFWAEVHYSSIMPA
ncbi:thiol-dependent ubiquitin-specific protease [Aureococcus anophagefferens]|uniref:Thiol-dependent ubiquitin-specific protease n=1 Tax=Aureococcus anophagefferens TaxID=44056 RepID=A0ABR1G6A3_AURAN